jgi:5-methylcytosine-specific restriction endonuclease McrA
MRHFFDEGRPSIYEEQKAKRAEAKRVEREVYKSVDHRDKFTCRACGGRADPNAIGLLNRGHRHHIVYRSAGGATSRQNCCLVCAECHDRIHQQRTLTIQGNADAVLEFIEWTWVSTVREEVRTWFD